MYRTSGYENYKYLHPQQGSSQIHKPTLNHNKETHFLRGKYIPIQASLQRIEKSKKQFLYSHFKKLELEQNRPNPLTRKELTKIRAESNEVETRKTVEQCNKTGSWFFKRINKIDKPLTKLIQRKEN